MAFAGGFTSPDELYSLMLNFVLRRCAMIELLTEVMNLIISVLDTIKAVLSYIKSKK